MKYKKTHTAKRRQYYKKTDTGHDIKYYGPEYSLSDEAKHYIEEDRYR